MSIENPNEKEIETEVKALAERVSLLERVVGTMAAQRGTTVPVHAPVQGAVPAKPKMSTEIEVGQKWLSIVGVLLIFLAALFFVQFVFQYVGPVGKVMLSYLVAAILFGTAAFTKKKYPHFSGVVSAGAWGVAYLVTYAMYFFPATRLITSAPFAMFLLAGVVGALVIVALYQHSKPLVSVALVLGVLTMILSPLSLFSIFGTVLIFAVFAAIAITMPWGDFMLPATIGAYISYFFWYGNVLGRLPAQGGGLLEKQMIGLVVLVILWMIVAVALLLRKDEEKSFGGNTDALTFIISSGGTAMLGILALHELVLVQDSIRIARAMWLLILAVLIGGWSVIAHEFRKKKDLIASGGVLSTVLLMSSIAYFLPEQSSGTALAWATMGLVIVLIGMVVRNMPLAVISAIPLVASALRFLFSDMQKQVVPVSTDFSINIVLGFVVAMVITGSAALLRTLDVATHVSKQAHRLPGILLVIGLVVVYAVTADELTGALPSVLWSFVALATITAGFLAHYKDARIIGLVGLFITVLRVFVYDLSNLDALPRVISFAILGGLLVLVGYGYNHNKEKLQKYLIEG